MANYNICDTYLRDYLEQVELYAEPDTNPCPRCGCLVELTTSRDINVGEMSVCCLNKMCNLSTFRAEYITSCTVNPLMREGILEMYNNWCKTKPTRYCEDTWIHHTLSKEEKD